MKNKYFQTMRKRGIEFKKMTGCSDLYTVSESAAFRFWAISDRLNATEVIIDNLPDNVEIEEFLNTYRNAGIYQLLITDMALSHIEDLVACGCRVICNAKVRFQETQLYKGKIQYADGVLVQIDLNGKSKNRDFC